ncbi:MAG TPA: DUF2270 domain-containing protein [Anaerolineae bacterium]|nr:DUF2270 domain-containing protein [Anaerolineae bacterium]HOV49498.1 DUF2270 domain-containing protein [Anaerolineae bacterium]HPD41193.1 DUF2270 domain-containing protein [Anaerolineae bacterium]HUM37723.1 DUF2270 domain-containing protein [Anaerolineae bacterium]HXK41652.1 DUF2270 domain-containing protein [Anaerolineae bacterium]
MSEEQTDYERETWSYHGYHLDRGNFTTAMVHYYRAEVTRCNTWRNRLDTTTNWAVVTTAAALTFTFSSPQNPHIVMLLVIALTLVFLWMEARRYSYYSLWYHRVRLLETEFFAKMLAPPFRPADDWGDAMAETLMNPVFPTSRFEAMGVRYRRNYVWLITLSVLSWFIKLWIHPEPAASFKVMSARATIGFNIPGPWIIAAVVAVYLSLTAMMIAVNIQERRATAELRKEEFHGRRMFPSLRPQPQLAIIITQQRVALSQRIMHELERGVTALSGKGMYSGEDRDVLLCALTGVQLKHLRDIVSEVDPQAFVVVTQASSVRGRGFHPPS